MAEVISDCRSEEGVTIGLIDSIISVARVLAVRDLESEMVRSVLQDFCNDSDVKALLQAAEKAKEDDYE